MCWVTAQRKLMWDVMYSMQSTETPNLIYLFRSRFLSVYIYPSCVLFSLVQNEDLLREVLGWNKLYYQYSQALFLKTNKLKFFYFLIQRFALLSLRLYFLQRAEMVKKVAHMMIYSQEYFKNIKFLKLFLAKAFFFAVFV